MLDGAPDRLLDLYDLQRRTVAIEFVQEQSIANKKRLEASDPGGAQEESRRTARDRGRSGARAAVPAAHRHDREPAPRGVARTGGGLTVHAPNRSRRRPACGPFLAADCTLCDRAPTRRAISSKPASPTFADCEPKVGAFVTLSIEARARGGRSLDRALARRQRRCRRSTACRWASRTSSRPPTCRPRWARRCSPAGARRRTPPASRRCAQAGAVIVGKTVTTEFAASEPRGTRNPWNLEHTPGGSRSGSAAAVACGMISAGARHAGDRLDHPAGELLRRLRLQADGRRAQPRRLPRLSEPELHRRARRHAGRHLAGRL